MTATDLAAPRSGPVDRRPGWTGRNPLGAFFVLAYAISWTGWLPAIVGLSSAPIVVLFFAGGLGPAISAVVATAPERAVVTASAVHPHHEHRCSASPRSASTR